MRVRYERGVAKLQCPCGWSVHQRRDAQHPSEAFFAAALGHQARCAATQG